MSSEKDFDSQDPQLDLSELKSLREPKEEPEERKPDLSGDDLGLEGEETTPEEAEFVHKPIPSEPEKPEEPQKPEEPEEPADPQDEPSPSARMAEAAAFSEKPEEKPEQPEKPEGEPSQEKAASEAENREEQPKKTGRFANLSLDSEEDKKLPPDERKKKKIAMISVITALAVVVICILLVGIFFIHAMLNRIQRPEFTDNSLSDEEFQYWATYNPDAEGAAALGTDENGIAVTVAETLPPVEGDYITNILVIGQDYRKGEDTKLADSIILCSFNRKNATLTLTSFLRDTYIQMPNYKGHTCGKNRINVVYNLGWQWGGDLGGMEMMDKCLKENFGIEVDYNVEVNFETFSQIINKLGGVDVELNEAEVNYLKRDRTGFNNYVRPGMNHLDGYTALCYARARKLDGDFQRTGRQRKIVSAIVEQVRSMGLKEIKDLVWDILPLVITDMENDEILDLIKDALPLLPKLKINAGMCPAEGTYWGEMLDIAGVPSSVIGIYLKPNQKLLQWICEVPAFEASPDEPPEIETLPPPKKKKPTETTEEETVAQTTKPSTEATEETETENVPEPENPNPKPNPDPDTKPDPENPQVPENGGENGGEGSGGENGGQPPEKPEIPGGDGDNGGGGDNGGNGGNPEPPVNPDPPVPPVNPETPAPPVEPETPVAPENQDTPEA